MPLYDLKCPCGLTSFDVLVRKPADMKCMNCGKKMKKLPSLPAAPVFAAGKSAQSQHEWAKKEKARLTKRSADYDKTKGKAEREATIEKLRAKGTIPKGWSA